MEENTQPVPEVTPEVTPETAPETTPAATTEPTAEPTITEVDVKESDGSTVVTEPVQQ